MLNVHMHTNSLRTIKILVQINSLIRYFFSAGIGHLYGNHVSWNEICNTCHTNEVQNKRCTGSEYNTFAVVQSLMHRVNLHKHCPVTEAKQLNCLRDVNFRHRPYLIHELTNASAFTSFWDHVLYKNQLNFLDDDVDVSLYLLYSRDCKLVLPLSLQTINCIPQQTNSCFFKICRKPYTWYWS